MDRKIKLVAATSLLGLTAVACAPNPYYYQNNTGARAATNGYAANRGGVAANGVAVTHTHCGRTHTHVMPAGQHQHGDGCMATNNTPAAATNTAGNYNYNQQPAANTYAYGATTAPTTNYDYSAGYGTGSNYNASTSGSGYNTGTSAGSNYNNYSTAGSGSSYYDYVAPKGSTVTPANNYRSTTVAPRNRQQPLTMVSILCRKVTRYSRSCGLQEFIGKTLSA